jgi:hypothetical protein
LLDVRHGVKSNFKGIKILTVSSWIFSSLISERSAKRPTKDCESMRSLECGVPVKSVNDIEDLFAVGEVGGGEEERRSRAEEEGDACGGVSLANTGRLETGGEYIGAGGRITHLVRRCMTGASDVATSSFSGGRSTFIHELLGG